MKDVAGLGLQGFVHLLVEEGVGPSLLSERRRPPHVPLQAGMLLKDMGIPSY